MISISDYKQLSISHRADLVISEGKFLTHRTSQTFHVDLYRLYDFYVEIWNNTIHGILMNIEAFDDEVFLKPYLDSFDLDDLSFDKD